VLSKYYEDEDYALDLVSESAKGVGYLLKEQVGGRSGVHRRGSMRRLGGNRA